ncbi:MaoC family dehydratase [Pseudorhodoferax soli]|uniref:Acyl dehydratase n=1 Tax=Pseudorhodoferax soli TaxID=545864 RepID=A0A368XKQ5_9BURK|nr:MaoC/PaaZ C-terminal domain-containing protein [Pseudorhodoferax soli]RCW68490.1 acyl dehydratase [Pseudorhodoferax soli]
MSAAAEAKGGSRRIAPRTPVFEDFVEGDVHVSYSRTVTESHLVGFTAMAGLQLPLFIDREHARAATAFGGPIAPGFLTASLSAGMMESILGPNTLAGLGMDAFRFLQPVRVGDTLHAEVRISGTKETRDPTRGVVSLAISVLNQRDEVALDYTARVLMKRA